jgi:hypothetical protein
LAFPQRLHELNPSQGALGGVERFEPQHGPRDSLDGSMVLFHHIIQILHLADADRGTVRFVIPPNGGGIGLAAINGNLLGDTMPADRLGEEAPGRLLVTLVCEQEINGVWLK